MAGESGALESAPLSTGSVGSVERPFVVGGEVVEVVVGAVVEVWSVSEWSWFMLYCLWGITSAGGGGHCICAVR